MAASYQTPLEDINFVLNEVLGMQNLSNIDRFADITPELATGILEEAGKLVEEMLAPISRSADEEGCTLTDKQVKTPAGYQEAYRLFTEGGWNGLSGEPEYDGQGLPFLFSQVIIEMMSSACMSFSLYPLLTAGACDALSHSASDEIKSRYMPKMINGEWSGTMCLTEPHSGSDLGLLRTKAVPAEDGSYRITGNKIFITAGEHDLSKNIIHLVLARLPGAPEGVHGISMFVVPKFLPDAEGNTGERNPAYCEAIEHKMGIHGSATCVMQFDEAQGWLVGEEGRGLKNMFVMMNAARLGVGIQGLGVCEGATQNAIRYAHDRKQGRELGHQGPLTESCPIIYHPDVRRMLLKMRALTEGGRIMAYEVAMNTDIARHHPDEKVRAAAQDHVELMTPVCKAFLTDAGVELASTGVQVLGGHGYIREHGMEQFLRDAKICCLYEGTNGIQAMDLVDRKLKMGKGNLMFNYFAQIEQALSAAEGKAELAFIAEPMQSALSNVKDMTSWLVDNVGINPNDLAASGVDYLRAFGLLAIGYAWLRTAAVAVTKQEQRFYGNKLLTARFYAERILPEVQSLLPIVKSGAESVMVPVAEYF